MVAIKAGTFSGTLKKGAKLGPHDIDNARGVIRDLVGRSITLKPTKTSHGQSLAAQLKPDYLGLATQLAGPKIILVAVTRIERLPSPSSAWNCFAGSYRGGPAPSYAPHEGGAPPSESPVTRSTCLNEVVWWR